MARPFTGVVPPLLTPLTADEKLDRPAVKRMVDYVLGGGADGIFLLGSMSECPALTASVRAELVDAAVEAVAGRVPVIAGVLMASTANVMEEIKLFSGRGLSGYVVTTPYYFGDFSADDLVDHFTRIADASDLPYLIYNIPQATHILISADVMLRVMGHPMVAGAKDSAGVWPIVRTVLRNRSDDFTVLQGNTSMAASSVLAGCDGLVPGEGNIAPRMLCDLYAAAKRGDVKTAFDLEAKVASLMPGPGGWYGIHAHKLVAKALGLMEEYVARPLPTLRPEDRKRVLAAAKAADLPVDLSVA